MIRQIWIAECDLCGRTEEAKFVFGRYNGKEYDLPNGWGYGHNKNFMLCPECLAKLSKKEKKQNDTHNI